MSLFITMNNNETTFSQHNNNNNNNNNTEISNVVDLDVESQQQNSSSDYLNNDNSIYIPVQNLKRKYTTNNTDQQQQNNNNHFIGRNTTNNNSSSNSSSNTNRYSSSRYTNSNNSRSYKQRNQSPFKKKQQQQHSSQDINLFHSQHFTVPEYTMSNNNDNNNSNINNDENDNDNETVSNLNNENDSQSYNSTNLYYTPKSKQSFIDIYKNSKDSIDLRESINNLIENTQSNLNLNSEVPTSSLVYENEENINNNRSSYQPYRSLGSQQQQQQQPRLSSSYNFSRSTPPTTRYQDNNSNNDNFIYSSPNRSTSTTLITSPTKTPLKSTLQNQLQNAEDNNNHQDTPLSIDDLYTSTTTTTTSTSPSSKLKSISYYDSKSTSLMSSFRPKSIEIIDSTDNERFYDKVNKSKQVSRDEDITSLLEKLQSISQTHSWSFIKQLEKRIEEQKKQKPVLKPLTAAEEKTIQGVLTERNDNLLAEFNSITIYRRDIIKLKPGGWLNDEIINFYMELLKKRQEDNKNRYLNCHFFSSFFYQFLCNNNNTYSYQRVKKWTKDFDIFAKQKVCIPVHLGAHWCLAVINFVDKRFEYYDSLLGDNSQCLTKLRRYLEDEMNDKSKKGVINLSEFTDYTPKDIPVQQNGYDCGVFTCKFADYTARGLPLDFTQKDITLSRKIMILECINKDMLS
ncbi:sentrin/SUMO-specific protease [Heterostelium album PN500]|uniref:Sentrin/SUMO-specific protease n=1 Tax=Heterostelium pallidum (strain ATCC 26659 / Pp 5 / PN500) TaxID=670386 RepID=D3BBS0_HETP5|nr:sentrin/SUMO-specific protease [Heterostelium album PN500]EFA81103.1 sentrin/SUMO-specific protease [Heterostelium album PN500]|eukprot:XP_020433221.1 sentrin/SUMO-specific protease [Heterostelium album PN500]